MVQTVASSEGFAGVPLSSFTTIFVSVTFPLFVTSYVQAIASPIKMYRSAGGVRIQVVGFLNQDGLGIGAKVVACVAGGDGCA